MQKLIELANNSKLNILGRYFVSDDSLVFDNVASGIEFEFNGDCFKIKCKTIPHKRINPQYPMYTIISVMIDNNDPFDHLVDIKNESLQTIEFKVSTSGLHHVKIMKTDDPLISSFIVNNIDCCLETFDYGKRINIELYGDSISSGGDNMIVAGPSLDVVPGTGIGSATYATYLSFMLDANLSVLSRCGLCLYGASSFDQDVVVSKIYDKCSTQNLVEWNLESFIPDIVLINLGTNDELGNLFTPSNFKNEMINFVHTLLKKYNNNPTFIFIGGQMNRNKDILITLSESADELKKEGIKAFYYQTDKARRGHPNVFEHQKLAKDLFNFINKLSI